MVDVQAEQPSPLWRVCDPPELVWVDVAEVHKRAIGQAVGRPTSLIAHRGFSPRALAVTDGQGFAKGEVHRWLRVANNSWMGLTAYQPGVPFFGEDWVRHWVARDFLRPRAESDDVPPF
ncbi:hypothetical protein SAMN04488074_109223 [Lentzea albidocapillata subsp. violacea]|uniref:Uncharacterized protein n=1 Tax=Lentzea albidocapillata subsp. violacea TaxID=128104 RepID=A0A1G9I0H3_9PSEU|nr:hypothetical protein [Lentzea albidocapillata]SDL18546.1 hypothetical protein SAMN04488074_109223 [Lentzea albidocapillata subsp. violacea]